jgi:hypothetical protein
LVGGPRVVLISCEGDRAVDAEEVRAGEFTTAHAFLRQHMSDAVARILTRMQERASA